jgi:hypothetical protein
MANIAQNLKQKPRNNIPPPVNSDAARKSAWVRHQISSYAGDLAAWHLSGDCSEVEAKRELLDAGIGLARQLEAPADVGLMAAKAEWTAAVERFSKFYEALQDKLWPLGESRAPGELIMAAAHAVNEAHGTILPTPLLRDFARIICRGAWEQFDAD